MICMVFKALKSMSDEAENVSSVFKSWFFFACGGQEPSQILTEITWAYGKQIDHWLKGDSVSWSGWRLLGEIVWSASCVSLSCLYTRVNSNVRSVRLGFGFIFQWVGARNRKNWCTRSNPHRGFHEIKISCVSNLHWLSVLQAWKDATGVRGRYKT